jgi:hypothetical protein
VDAHVFSTRAILAVYVGGVILSFALGAGLMGALPPQSSQGGDDINSTSLTLSFELPVENPMSGTLADEIKLRDLFLRSLQEEFEGFQFSSAPTLSGYEVVGSLVIARENPTEVEPAALVQSIEVFATAYAQKHYRAALFFGIPTNFEWSWAAPPDSSFSIGRVATGGVMGGAIFSVAFLLFRLMIGTGKAPKSPNVADPSV